MNVTTYKHLIMQLYDIQIPPDRLPSMWEKKQLTSQISQ